MNGLPALRNKLPALRNKLPALIPLVFSSTKTEMDRKDREFLPQALEIIVTPPSPIRISFLYSICAFFVALLAWSYFGFLDVHAVASGKIQPTGRSKVIQPVDSGKVIAIHVTNGSRVRAGDVLVELDPVDTTADLTAAQTALIATRAEIVRRGLAISTAAAGIFDPLPAIRWDDDIPDLIRHRETRILHADLTQLSSSLTNLRRQRSQKEAELGKYQENIKAQKSVLDVMNQRLGMRKELLRTGSGPLTNVLDSLQEVGQAEATVVALEGSVKEATSALGVLDSQIANMRDGFISDNANKLAEAERRSDGLAQQVAKAAVKLDHTKLTAPVSGAIQALTVTSLNQVVAPGQELMRLVPDGLPLEIEAYVLNKDIGFVKEGQEAAIKVDAFPYTRYGTIDGRVTSVATDAISGAEAAQSQINLSSDQTNSSRTGVGTSAVLTAAQRTQDLVYQVIVVPSATTMMIDGKLIPLSAGMSVTVEIKTEQRRVIDYLFSPLIAVGSAAMRER